MTRAINHIVAATDLSAPSLHALERGFSIARETSARYTVMHALGLDALGPLRNLLGEQAEEVSRRAVEYQRMALEAILADPARNLGQPSELRVEPGRVSVAVPAFLAASDADLVVLGARGEGRMRRFVFGSTASHLLRKSACPVLVVKQVCREPYRRVLISVDFSPASESAILAARRIAPHAGIVLLNVVDVPFEGMLRHAGVSKEVIRHYRVEAHQRALEQLHELAAKAALDGEDYAAVVERGDAADRIHALQKQDCDLVVMGKHGTHVTEELLLGSVTKRVVEEAGVDVLVVIDRREPGID